jgi:peroxiredoxin
MIFILEPRKEITMAMPNRRHKPRLLFVAILAVFFLVGGHLQAASRMPDFNLASVTGDGTINSSNFQGQVLLVNFFATWCPPCRQEIPSLVQLQKEFGPRGFTVIGISVDQADIKLVSKFIDKMGVNYPVAMGTTAVAKGFGGVVGIPATFLVDRKGNVMKSYSGLTEHKILAHDIKKVL